MRNNMRRNLGTVLMAVGLLTILSVGGYFAWNEVQAAQVRDELDAGAAAAALRATEAASALARSAPLRTDTAVTAVSGDAAGRVAAAKAALTATRSPVLPDPAIMPATEQPLTPAPSATATATKAATASRVPATVAPTAAPVAPAPAAQVALVPVRLVIPDLKIDTKVVEMGWTVNQTSNGPVSEWDIPKNAAGHHKNSARVGEQDNLVISGHNNIYGRVFMPISQAWSNDKRVKVDNFTDKSNVLDGREIVLYDAAGNQHKYVITDFLRLKDTGVTQQQRIANGKYILPTGDERVTIVTCWPPTNNTHRLIVIARPES